MIGVLQVKLYKLILTRGKGLLLTLKITQIIFSIFLKFSTFHEFHWPYFFRKPAKNIKQKKFTGIYVKLNQLSQKLHLEVFNYFSYFLLENH